MIHAELSGKIIAGYYDVYNHFAGDHLESTYQRSLAIVLGDRGLSVEQEVSFTILFRGQDVGVYRLDLLVENKVVVECKATSRIHPVHERQIAHYLRATDFPLGLLLNFGPSPQFMRFINSKVKSGANDVLFKRRA